MRNNYEMDMCHGALFKKLIYFAIPLILSSVLQLLFNAADIIVVGRFSGAHALAAVGSTSSLINLLVNLFMGISIGANVLLGRYYGAGQYDDASKTVHTAMITAMVGGTLLIAVGIFFAAPLLEMMGTPSDVIALSTLYMRIYFLGMPAFAIYNFGAALLRALGDTKRPLYFLSFSGAINVLFNLFFVIVLHMGVAGVAFATILSEMISAGLILWCLHGSEGVLQVRLRELHFDRDKFIEMLRIGLPAGLQGVVFNISNVLIQSSVNSFGSLVMAGNTAANNIEGFVYVSMNAIHQTALSFTSQNYGAKQYHRIDRILLECLAIVTVVGLVFGGGAYLFGSILLSVYSTDPIVIQYGLNRLSIICTTYFLCGIMDVCVGSLRGLGYAIMPMIVSLSGACLLRVIWIFTIFQMFHTQFSLYISYPITWIVTAMTHIICYLVVRKKWQNGMA